MKTMYVCILDAAGRVMIHPNVKSSPEAFLELTLARTAQQHDADAVHRLRSVPVIGKVLAFTILFEIP